VWTIAGSATNFNGPTSNSTISVGATVVPLAATMSVTSLDPNCTTYIVRVRGGTGGGGGIFWDFRFSTNGTLTLSAAGNPDTNNSGSPRTLFITASCSNLSPGDPFSFSVAGSFTFRVERPPTAFA
jgi:hypothetical protein